MCEVVAVDGLWLQVYFAVKLLERLGQHKTARRLKYGHMAWEIQNSAKTDRYGAQRSSQPLLGEVAKRVGGTAVHSATCLGTTGLSTM